VANAGVRGRPIEPLVLSAQERAHLERQVRRHRVARSLSERFRAILRCADGLPSKSVTVCSWMPSSAANNRTSLD